MRRLSFMALLLVGLTAMARQLTPAEAVQRLTQRSQGRAVPSRMYHDMQLVHTLQDDENYFVYVMNVAGERGFYILSADDCAPAVLGYSDHGTFSYEDAPEQLKWWLSQYSQAIKAAIDNGEVVQQTETRSSKPVGPLLTCSWNQDSPFNLLCTENGYQAPSGCVATAMAQVMYHHRWPVQGTASMSYSDDSSGKGVVISSDFYKHTYAWDAMLDNYDGESTDENDMAVAVLMKDCGVSVNMGYGRNSSGAPASVIPSSICRFFGYSWAVRMETRVFYTDAQWEALLYSELAQDRPVIYAGRTVNDEGHCFVCDGYDGEGYFHFNWGWGGKGDGFYLVTGAGALQPNVVGIGGAEGAFSMGQFVITNIRKPEAGESAQSYELLCASDGYQLTVLPDKSIQMDLTYYSGGTATVPSTAMLAINFENPDTVITREISTLNIRLLPGSTLPDTRTVSYNKPLPPGEYDVYPAYTTLYEEKTTKFGASIKTYYGFQHMPLPANYQSAKIRVTDTGITILSQGYVDTTPILAVRPNTQTSSSDALYNLQGQRISLPTRGIYIHNGKKILVK